MRLSEKETITIQNAVLLFDRKAQTYVFGSRVYGGAKGGDIDIPIISEKIGFAEKIKIRTLIFEEIEERKLDLVGKKNF